MGSTLKSTGEIESVYISSHVDYIIGTEYSGYSEDIIDALSYIPYNVKDSVKTFAFKVGDKDPVFFEFAIYYSDYRQVHLDGVWMIDVDEFLDHVKHKTWIKNEL